MISQPRIGYLENTINEDFSRSRIEFFFDACCCSIDGEFGTFGLYDLVNRQD